MAKAGFLADNEQRDYPFLTRVNPLELPGEVSSEGSAEIRQLLALPHEAIVDFGAIMDLDAEFDESAGDYVYLYAVRRAGDVYTYEFRATPPALADECLLFTRDAAVDEEFSSEWVDASSILTGPYGSEPCSSQPRWSGFMVSGRFDELAELLSDGEEIIFFEALWVVEPARIQNMLQGYLRSVNLGNFARLHAELPEVCQPSSSSSMAVEEDAEVLINTTCRYGELVFREGYSCVLRQESQSNSLVIGAAVGAGSGLPCGEIPLIAGETSPDGGRFLTGGPACDEIVKTINGKGGRRMTIKAGPGFRVTSDPDQAHALLISRALQDFASCLPAILDELSSVSSESLGSED